jgi:hypothetical protein
MNIFTLQEYLSPAIRKGNISLPLTVLTCLMLCQKRTPFNAVTWATFSNSPKRIAKKLDQIIEQESKKFTVAAIYVETNGFYINPDGWYFSGFAYKSYGGHEDYDWLAYPDYEDPLEITLTGMEGLQQIYTEYYTKPGIPEGVKDYCDLLVVCKFQDLIRRSIRFMHTRNIPILATGHDYDFIAEFTKR